MEIVRYPHPALRWTSAEVRQIDDGLRATVKQMFELMYEAKGIGLAANQVGLPFRFFIVNLSGDSSLTEEEHVFINPELRQKKGNEVGEEGCLSLPDLFADVPRFSKLVVEGFDLDGQGFEMRLDEIAARCIQHEADHLNGVLFIDKITDAKREEFSEEIAKFETEFRQAQKTGTQPPDEEIRRQLAALASTGVVPQPT